MIKIAFAGNPNVGKSALINEIAGSSLKVGNWPGVTVEKKEAQFEYKGEIIKLVDLPGVYSLSPYTLEEKITRDYIINENPILSYWSKSSQADKGIVKEQSKQHTTKSIIKRICRRIFK